MAKRGAFAAYPLATPVGLVFTPENERRFRAQAAAHEADTQDRLFALEQRPEGGGGNTIPLEIVRGATNATWQVVGDQLICRGTLTTAADGTATITFPRAFRAIPTLVATPVSGSALRRTVHTISRTATGANIISLNQTDVGTAMVVDWIAIGEALDTDRMPKTVPVEGP
jgi:hypothetical protein